MPDNNVDALKIIHVIFSEAVLVQSDAGGGTYLFYFRVTHV